MKKIVIITDGHFPEGDAGANRILYVAKAMVAAGFRVTVLCRGKYGDGEIDGIEYVSFREKKVDLAAKVMAYIRFSGNVRRYLEDHSDVDMVYIYNAPAAVFKNCKRSGGKGRFSLVYDSVEWYSQEQFKLKKFSYIYQEKNRTVTKVVDKAFRVIAISRFLENYYADRGLSVLRLPVLCEASQSQPKKICTDVLRIFYAGSPQGKDLVGNTLKAAQMLSAEEQKRLKLIFVGVTKEHLVNKCGVTEQLLEDCKDFIELHGRKPREQVLEMMQQADFVQLFRDASLRYAKAGFPSKIVESLANATPVFCNLSSDLAEYLRDGENALLAQSHHPEEIAKTMKRALALSAEEKMEMSRCAFASAKAHFDYHNYVDEIKGFLSHS